MRTIGSGPRVLQVHPSRWCNLSCLHCYSSSGPSETAQLDPELLEAAIRDAAAEDYTLVSISGGEPLMYAGLLRVLDAARSVGLQTALVSNGILLDARRVEQLASRLDFLAISLDGRPELHDRIRNSRGAFDRMTARLEHLRAVGIPFGFVFSLSQDSFDDLLWCLDFAVEQGARLFQIHPLDETGRALVRLCGRSTSTHDALVAWLAAQHLAKEYAEQIVVTIDLERTAAIPELVPELLDERDVSRVPLARAVAPLVIEDDGTVVPLEYGIDRRYALGSLREARLPELARSWLAAPSGHSRLRELCRRTLARIQANGTEISTWYQELMKLGRAADD